MAAWARADTEGMFGGGMDATVGRADSVAGELHASDAGMKEKRRRRRRRRRRRKRWWWWRES
eukprot:753281-Hanusia_phi.AAC.1